jgi:putative hemolysin
VDDSIPRSILLAVMILAGGFFAGSETAYSYCNRIRIKLRADDGDAGSKRVLRILDHFDRAIVTLLIGNNVIHIAAASMATVLAINLIGPSGSVVATVVMTLLVFFFSETLPKNIARANADAFAHAVSIPLSALMFLMTPLSAFFTWIGNVAKKLVGTGSREPSITEQELHIIVENSEEEGGIEPEDSELIQSAIEFSGTIVSQIMTPASKMVTLDIHDDPQVQLTRILDEKYSRIPVTDRNRVIGILQARKYLKSYLHTPTPPLRPLLSPPTFVRAKTPVNTLFEDMRRKKLHMCIVNDEQGHVVGLITMEDILEELVGDIMDEDDPIEEGCSEHTEPAPACPDGACEDARRIAI